MTFLHPVSDQRFLGIPGRSSLLLGFGSFRLPFSNELLLLLLDLVCKLPFSMDIITGEGVYWGSGPDGVATLGSDLRRAEVRIVRDLGSHGL